MDVAKLGLDGLTAAAAFLRLYAPCRRVEIRILFMCNAYAILKRSQFRARSITCNSCILVSTSSKPDMISLEAPRYHPRPTNKTSAALSDETHLFSNTASIWPKLVKRQQRHSTKKIAPLRIWQLGMRHTSETNTAPRNKPNSISYDSALACTKLVKRHKRLDAGQKESPLEESLDICQASEMTSAP